MNKPLDLDAIRHRVPMSYDGPWYIERGADGEWLVGYPTDNPLAGLVATMPDYGERLAEFVAHAREDVPALLAEVQRLRAATLPITCTLCGRPVQGVRCTPSCPPLIVTPSGTGEETA